jgi:DNA-binding NarL/FixJ family response regulator
VTDHHAARAGTSRTLLLVDDHPLFVSGFGAMLRQMRPEWELLSAYSSSAGVQLLGSYPNIDLAIVDIQLPDRDGFETVAAMGALRPDVPRLIISGREDATARAKARSAGACGFIAKAGAPDTVLDLIEAILSGDYDMDSGGAHSPEPGLSPRQFEVLMLLAEGCPNKVIRYRMGIAERTVRAHLTELFHCLGVTSRVQALVRARAMKLIE